MFSSVDSATRERYKIAHLLRRAGFGYTTEELAYYTGLGYDAAVTALVSFDSSQDYAAPQLPRLHYDDNTRTLQQYWLGRMFYTKAPLQEKMTLFWHSHFATSEIKLHNRYSVLQQNQTFRANALAAFDTILSAVAHDPAMLIWLDNASSHKKKPNENFGREFLELFSMGQGNYSEADVKASARAFSGWSVANGPVPSGFPKSDHPYQIFAFKDKDHDYDSKTFLGETGALDGDDIVRIVAKQPATAQFICRKLWQFFVWDSPDASVIARLAAVYFQSDYSIRAVVEAIFRSPEFVSDDAFHATIKSPAEFVVGTLKFLNPTRLPDTLPAVMKKLGQDLYHPPSVAGWPGGRSWITTATFYERANAVEALLTAFRDPKMFDSRLLHPAINPTGDSLISYYVDYILNGDLAATDRQALQTYLGAGRSYVPGELAQATSRSVDEKVRGLLHLLMTNVSYQLN